MVSSLLHIRILKEELLLNNFMKVGILGTGFIAEKMAYAIDHIDDIEVYAVASRDISRAIEFGTKHNVQKAYGSYRKLVEDENVDLVYVATPHNLHFENALMCIEHKKNVLVEKPFTVNRKQAEILFSKAKENNVFICEAMWTRFMPSRKILEEVIDSNIIGDIYQVTADLSYPMETKERIIRKELAGGALLDIGIYPLSFAQTVIEEEPINIDGLCTYLESGVDANDSITLTYQGNKTAVLTSSMMVSSSRTGVIYGEKGYIVVEHIGNIDFINIYDSNDTLLQRLKTPEQINGYEYEIIACKKALEKGKLECEEHTHANTLQILSWMDTLRNKWNIKYPFE